MSDQTTGAPPPDPNDPAQSSQTAVPQPEPEQEGEVPKSPDEEGGSDEAREGGTPTHSRERSDEAPAEEQQ